MASSPLTIYQ